MIAAAVAQIPRIRHVDDPVHKCESTPFFLRQGNKVDAVVTCLGIDVHRPTWSCGAGVHIQRINKMLLGRSVDQRIKEKPSGSEIDDGRPSDASRINISARKTGCNGWTNIGARPDW